MKTMIFLCFMLVLGLAGLGLYQFEKMNNESLQTKETLASLKSNLSKVNSKEEQTNADLAELQRKYQLIKLDENWKISEAIHLLRLATLELQVSRDIPTTLKLLEAADNQLDTIQDPSLLPIRDLISKEKLALKEVKSPNLEKLWLQVGTFIDQIPSLKTQGVRFSSSSDSSKATDDSSDNLGKSQENSKGISPEGHPDSKQKMDHSSQKIDHSAVQSGTPPETHFTAPIESDQKMPSAADHLNNKNQDTTTTNKESKVLSNQDSNSVSNSSQKTSENSAWQKSLGSAWQEFKGLIKIQEHNKPIQPILTATEQVLAKENLLLIMEQVRWAILHENNTVYQKSITEAKQWITQYFESSDPKTKEIQNGLEALASVDLRPPLPDLGQALQALQKKG